MAVEESYIVVIGRDKNGKRTADRAPLVVPAMLACGKYEALSNRSIQDMINDLTAEQLRRF
jgi:hypothetical protein